jgi:hypothetical protein
MIVTNVLFQNNTATAAAGVGGTAYLAGSKGYVFDNSGFLASTSGSYGGALYVSTYIHVTIYIYTVLSTVPMHTHVTHTPILTTSPKAFLT